jgi:hypothetical protein
LQLACAAILHIKDSDIQTSFIGESGLNFNIARLAWLLLLESCRILQTTRESGVATQQWHDCQGLLSLWLTRIQQLTCCVPGMNGLSAIIRWLTHCIATTTVIGRRSLVSPEQLFALFIEKDDDLIRVLYSLSCMFRSREQQYVSKYLQPQPLCQLLHSLIREHMLQQAIVLVVPTRALCFDV